MFLLCNHARTIVPSAMSVSICGGYHVICAVVSFKAALFLCLSPFQLKWVFIHNFKNYFTEIRNRDHVWEKDEWTVLINIGIGFMKKSSL